MSNSASSPDPAQTPHARAEVRHPITTLLVPTIAITLTVQVVSLVAGWSVMPAKVLELVLLLGGATFLTARAGGRNAVRSLYAGLRQWRIGPSTSFLALAALPLLTTMFAAVTGTIHIPHGGITPVLLLYLLYLVFGAVTANLWEETVWSGFIQERLMTRHGLLRGSLITAVPFFLIHLPLAFEEKGWPGTSWQDALETWAMLLVAAPFLRYLIGIVLIDTGSSLLAAGFLHASFNASGALPIAAGGWQYVPAMITLTTIVGAIRWRNTRAQAPRESQRKAATTDAGPA
jgi:membrane protease YdiL (CAAX protease family)